MPKPKVRVLVVDDHPIVRAGLCDCIRSLPDADVAGEASTGEQALEKVQTLWPDVVLLDLSLPGLNGLEVLRRLVKEHPIVRVIVVSAHSYQEHVWACLRAGAAGFMAKSMALVEIGPAIQSAMRGEVFLSRDLATKFKFNLSQIREHVGPLEMLSQLQREVLTGVAQGLTSKEMALKLDLSIKTLEYHRARLMENLGVWSVAGLTAFAVRHGLIDVDRLNL